MPHFTVIGKYVAKNANLTNFTIIEGLLYPPFNRRWPNLAR